MSVVGRRKRDYIILLFFKFENLHKRMKGNIMPDFESSMRNPVDEKL